MTFVDIIAALSKGAAYTVGVTVACIATGFTVGLAVAVIRRLGWRFAAPLDACDWVHGLSMGRRPAALIYRLVCVDEDACDWPDDDIGNLRVGLNALAGMFRLKVA